MPQSELFKRTNSHELRWAITGVEGWIPRYLEETSQLCQDDFAQR